MFHLQIIKLAVRLGQFIQERQQGSAVPLAVAEIGELFPECLVGSDLERGVERLARSLDMEVFIEH